MFAILIQMGVLIACGAAWRMLRPGGLAADEVRRVLTGLVFYLLLPALVLSVLWVAPLGLESLRISAYGAALVFAGAAMAWLSGRVFPVAPRRLGAIILAVAFANVTYLGLPVLEHTFGPWARAIAIQIDLFASLPLVLSFGILIARHYGSTPPGEKSLAQLFLVNPPLWAGLVGTGLNLGGVPRPAVAELLLAPLAGAVVPLMLIALGLGLDFRDWRWRNLPLASLVLALKLGVVPAFGLWLGIRLGFRGDTLGALVLEAAMPSMVLGIVYCDRYRLDSEFYAMVVTLATASTLVTLPFWQATVLAAGTP